ncbi:hypothetical protein GGI15_004127 [Coemansia interrupta]|uniref:Pet127-domain-containing protein n=1 Tax=Coemansia interrupta TaxID=1126814 RepID=A0A9W8H4R7_9FUNG|nr:hypothetical protein GGI15_004127 [Coemansia interrupta]
MSSRILWLYNCRISSSSSLPLKTYRFNSASVQLYRRYASTKDSPDHDLADQDTSYSPSVVIETPPVYTKEEAEEIGDSTIKSSRSGLRTDFIKEREPVVVHKLTYPFQTNKWYRILPDSVDFVQVGNSHIKRVPRLQHGLERVLFSPGVHCLEDPHSGVYNFDPYIRNITQPEEFDYDKLTPYITSSKDETLMGYARKCRKQFVGSTSSMTHALSHLYFAISGGKQPDVSSLSMAYADMPTNFTRGMRYPASIALRYHDGVYGIDADKSFDVKDSILSILGKSLEKLLTSSPKEFETYKKQNSWKVKDIQEENYHYVQFDEFVLRSQLDCRDDRLPRKTFDLKTRGTLAVRMDLENYEVSKGYQIHTLKGRLQSFEREYYDMARSAFLKYNFQTRIGNMDGIFVAYHNTARMFGFQYIPRQEMDNVVFGNEATGTKMFRSILILLGKILRSITDQFPKKDIRVTFDSSFNSGKLNIWVEMINDEAEAVALQQYEELGINGSRVRKSREKQPAKAADGGTDPFDTNDPLDAQGSKDGSAASELDDTEFDLADFIYINDKETIQHYTMDAFSTYNNMDTDEPVTVRNKDEELYINWKLTKSRDTQESITTRYKQLRMRQATYFERAAPDTPEEELSPMIKILRNISRRNMWRNDMPRGKVVVNRSKRPTVASKWPSVHSAQTGNDAESKPSESKSSESKSSENESSERHSSETKSAETKSRKPKKTAAKKKAARGSRLNKKTGSSRIVKRPKSSKSQKDTKGSDVDVE